MVYLTKLSLSQNKSQIMITELEKEVDENGRSLHCGIIPSFT
jgi:hypothetical protein